MNIEFSDHHYQQGFKPKIATSPNDIRLTAAGRDLVRLNGLGYHDPAGEFAVDDVIAGLLCSGASGGPSGSRSGQGDAAVLQEIERLWAESSIHPGLVETGRTVSSKDAVSIRKEYRSETPFETISDFYNEGLPPTG